MCEPFSRPEFPQWTLVSCQMVGSSSGHTNQLSILHQSSGDSSIHTSEATTWTLQYIQVLVSCCIFFLTNCTKWISVVNCHMWKDFQWQIWWLETCSPIFTCPLFFSQSALAIQGAHSPIFYPSKFCHVQNYKDNFEISIYKLYTQKLVHTVKWRVRYGITVCTEL